MLLQKVSTTANAAKHLGIGGACIYISPNSVLCVFRMFVTWLYFDDIGCQLG